ncbi:MAG: YtxH domain-containing protein [Dehalococcoidales bacterium]|nr:YtxH domain-containing protein [Dehalococcoidales bacterium]
MAGKDSGFLLGFIIGAIAGIAVGLLYAPKPGKETRAILREKAERLKERASEIFSRSMQEKGG